MHTNICFAAPRRVTDSAVIRDSYLLMRRPLRHQLPQLNDPTQHHLSSSRSARIGVAGLAHLGESPYKVATFIIFPSCDLTFVPTVAFEAMQCEPCESLCSVTVYPRASRHSFHIRTSGSDPPTISPPTGTSYGWREICLHSKPSCFACCRDAPGLAHCKYEPPHPAIIMAKKTNPPLCSRPSCFT